MGHLTPIFNEWYQRKFLSTAKTSEPNAFAGVDRRVNGLDQLDRSETVIGRHRRRRAVQDGIDKSPVFLQITPLFFLFKHVERKRFKIRVHASRIEQTLHFFGHYRSVMAEHLDAFERKMPARVRGRGESAVKSIAESEDDRELIKFGVLVPRAVGHELFDLAELESHHVEKMDRRLVKETAGHADVSGPDGIL